MNRLNVLDDQSPIDAWTTIEAYQNFQLQLLGYLADSLSPIAGATMDKLRFDPVSRQIAAASTAGVTLVRSGVGTPPPQEPGDFEFVIYPNPFPGREGNAEGVMIGGIEGEGSVYVSVYDLQGIPILKRRKMEIESLAAEPVWDGETSLAGQLAASGLYVIQVEWEGVVSNKVVAVER